MNAEIICHGEGCASHFPAGGQQDFHHRMLVREGVELRCPVCQGVAIIVARRTSARFAIGQVTATPAAQAAIRPLEAAVAVTCHAQGDWGDVDDEDKAANDAAICDAVDTGDPSKILQRQRVLSVWKTEDGETFWIITEAGRHVTTILLPSDY